MLLKGAVINWVDDVNWPPYRFESWCFDLGHNLSSVARPFRATYLYSGLKRGHSISQVHM